MPHPAEAPSTASKLASGLKAALGIKNRRQQPPSQSAAAPPKSEREAVIEQLEAADQQGVEETDYELPPLDLLLPNEHVSYEEHEKEVRRKAKILEKTFKDFGFNIRVVEIETGPVIAQFEVELEAGLRLSKITGLADDLAIALRVPSVRIGVHVGDCWVADDKCTGLAIHIGARIAALARADEILVSEAAKTEAGSSYRFSEHEAAA